MTIDHHADRVLRKKAEADLAKAQTEVAQLRADLAAAQEKCNEWHRQYQAETAVTLRLRADLAAARAERDAAEGRRKDMASQREEAIRERDEARRDLAAARAESAERYRVQAATSADLLTAWKERDEARRERDEANAKAAKWERAFLDRNFDAASELAALRRRVEEKDAALQRLANAVQAFRNVPMLGRHVKLRSTPEYVELCEAWRAWRDYAALAAPPVAAQETPVGGCHFCSQPLARHPKNERGELMCNVLPRRAAKPDAPGREGRRVGGGSECGLTWCPEPTCHHAHDYRNGCKPRGPYCPPWPPRAP